MLTKLAPVAVLAEVLGYSPATIERHAVDSATNYARYVAAVHQGWAHIAQLEAVTLAISDG